MAHRFILSPLFLGLLACGGGSGDLESSLKLWQVENGTYTSKTAVSALTSLEQERCKKALEEFTDNGLAFVKDTFFIGAGGGQTAHGVFYTPASGHSDFSLGNKPESDAHSYTLEERWTLNAGSATVILAERNGAVEFVEPQMLYYSGALTLSLWDGPTTVLCYGSEYAWLPRTGDAPPLFVE